MKRVLIRQACDKDIPFLAWVMSTAARSHLSKNPWNIIFNESEARTLALLERTIQIPELYWSYLSNFWVIESEGSPAAAMCAFAPSSVPDQDLSSLQCSVVSRESDYYEHKLDEIKQRLAIATLGLPEELHDAWGIESVAVLPEFQGKGLIDQLFEHVFEQGKMQGYQYAQIMCLIGNDQAQQAFERNGFKAVSQKTNVEFEALFGTSGAMLMVKGI